MALDEELIIENIIQDYIKPKYPIYKIRFIITKCVRSYEIDTQVVTRIVECKENILRPFLKIELGNDGQYIQPSTLSEFSARGYVKVHSYFEHITIFEITQIA